MPQDLRKVRWATFPTRQPRVQTAVDGGITFFDYCWEYHPGKLEIGSLPPAIVPVANKSRFLASPVMTIPEAQRPFETVHRGHYLPPA